MIYDSLDIIPIKIFNKIDETGDVSLLSDIEEDTAVLSEIWERLHDQHLSKNQTSESKKIFKLSLKIDELLTLNKTIVIACACLKFDFDQEIFDMLIGYGYKLSLEDTEKYYYDIDRIERESNAYIVKAEYYKGMLPERKETGKNDFNLDDVIASHSAILGYDLGDYNTLSYNKFYANGRQVTAKIESLERQKTKADGK